jgi:hypothetical protein
MADDGSREERRSSHRHKTLISGWLVYGHEAFTLQCVIRDLSRCGAKISVKNPSLVPNEVTLIDARSLTAYEAVVRWRRDMRLGLSFLNTVSLEDQSTLRLRHLRRIALSMKLSG